MAQIDKNTVKAENQLGNLNKITFENKNCGGKKILFVGNSITRHAPKSDIGWFNDWGMAASSKDKDYVHVLENMILKTNPDAEFCICQLAEWERSYKTGDMLLDSFNTAREFNADIIVIRLIENCPHNDFDHETFSEQYGKMIGYLNKSGKAEIVVTTGFWKHPADTTISQFAAENGFDCVYLGELGEKSEMRADGLFKHSGVAAHPGDKGMENIAMMIYEKLKKHL